MPSALTWLCACIYLSACIRASLGVPPQHRGWLRLWEEGAGCGKCNPRLCPRAPGGCPAGRVRDDCGCCEQCANVEGQQCDPDGAQKFYGRCGVGLVCQRKTSAMRGQRGKKNRAEPEPTCVCRDEGPVCGSDGWTYPNVCQLREASSRSKTILRMTGQGPCYSAPRILRVPRDVSNFTGNDVVFGCEVSAYPLPTLSWKKKGSDHFLPGDDPHISVQLRGGPERYTMSSWLQIQNLQLSHAGIYSCISHNALGGTSASARLTVMRRASTVVLMKVDEENNFDVWEDDDGGDDGSGDYLQ